MNDKSKKTRFSSHYHEVLDLLKAVEGGLICGTAYILSSLHFLLDLLLEISLESLNPFGVA